MQRGGMTVPNGLLLGRSFVDRLQREGDLNQFLFHSLVSVPFVRRCFKLGRNPVHNKSLIVRRCTKECTKNMHGKPRLSLRPCISHVLSTEAFASAQRQDGIEE